MRSPSTTAPKTPFSLDLRATQTGAATRKSAISRPTKVRDLRPVQSTDNSARKKISNMSQALTPKLTNKRVMSPVRNESPAKLLKQTMTSAREASKHRNTARNISKPVLNKAA